VTAKRSDASRPARGTAASRRTVSPPSLAEVGGAVDAQVARERARLAVAAEVRVEAVRPGRVEPQRDAPATVVRHPRVQVLEGRQVAAHDDRVHAPLVAELERADRATARVDDAEAERLRPPARQLGRRDGEAEAGVGAGEAVGRGVRVVRRHRAAVHRRRGAGRLRPERGSGGDRGAEDGGEREREAERAPHGAIS
jgi:hypothetical protein